MITGKKFSSLPVVILNDFIMYLSTREDRSDSENMELNRPVGISRRCDFSIRKVYASGAFAHPKPNTRNSYNSLTCYVSVELGSLESPLRGS